jgi:hypothetical protein
MAEFPPQNVANILGSFPKLGCNPPASFWDKALPAVQRALPAFKPLVSACVRRVCERACVRACVRA